MPDLSLAATRSPPSVAARWFALALCAAGAILFLNAVGRPVALEQALASTAGTRLVHAICRQIPHCARARMDRVFIPGDSQTPAGWYLRIFVAGQNPDPVLVRATITRLLLRSQLPAFRQQAHAFLLRLLPAAAADHIKEQS